MKRKPFLPKPPVTIPALTPEQMLPKTFKRLRKLGVKPPTALDEFVRNSGPWPGKENLEKLPKLKRKLAAKPKPKLPRPSIPIKIKLQVALEQLAMMIGDKEVQLDHEPALENRKFDPATGKYTPDANDPKYLIWRGKDAHDKKTHGPGGSKRITTKGSDNHTREHREALSESERKYRDRMAAKGKPVVPRRG